MESRQEREGKAGEQARMQIGRSGDRTDEMSLSLSAA